MLEGGGGGKLPAPASSASPVVTSSTMSTRHRRRRPRLDARWRSLVRLALVRRFFRRLWHHLVACSSHDPSAAATTTTDGNNYQKYRRYRYRPLNSSRLAGDASVDADSVPATEVEPPDASDEYVEADTVSLKISLLGDCHIGKTSFMNKYVGDEEMHTGLQLTGLNTMNKILAIEGARISYHIWDVGGDGGFVNHLPIACKDAVAILIMFDLTTRCTLNNSIAWYRRARTWNKTAIPVLIGTKFDDFVQFPLEMQWTVVNQARAYAKAMKATLFFSSTTHNINVNKIFKFITAKLFNLPWTIEKNLTIGEPIVDF